MHTLFGIYGTQKHAELDITFPQYSNSKRFHIQANLVEYNPDDYSLQFKLIIGTDYMSELEMDINFKEGIIEIDRIVMPMRKLRDLQETKRLRKLYNRSLYIEPLVTDLDTKCITEILNAKCEKADLEAIVKGCMHLTGHQKIMLLEKLQEYEELFDVTLGY